MADKNIKILYVLNKCPYPLFDGTRERILGEIKFLSQEYTLDILIITTENITEEQLKHVKEQTSGSIHLFKISKITAYRNSLIGLFSDKPIQAFYFISRLAKNWLAQNAKDYQSIYFHTIRNGEYISHLKSRNLCPNTKLILSFNDAISLHYKRAKEKAVGLWRIIYTIEEKRLRNYEISMLDLVDGSSIVSQVDRDYINKNWTDKFNTTNNYEISIIRNGVNDEYTKYEYSGENKNLVFFGNLLYPPNRQGLEYFVKNIWPEILKNAPQTKLIIIGRGGDTFKHVENTEVLGFVENPYQKMCSQAALINPINFGAGVPTKVLLSMAIGLPVVAYHEGVTGIENLRNDENIILITQQDIKSSVLKICELLNNQKLRKEISLNGKKLVMDKYLASKNYPDLGLLLTKQPPNW